jgi:hypothetical protein
MRERERERYALLRSYDFDGVGNDDCGVSLLDCLNVLQSDLFLRKK